MRNITKHNLRGHFRIIPIDGKSEMLPNCITQVPSCLFPEQKRVLVDDELFNYVESLSKSAETEIQAYYEFAMGNKMSDAYSFIEDTDTSDVARGFANVHVEQKINTVDDKEFNKYMKNDGSSLDALRAERDSDIKRFIPPQNNGATASVFR
jgi:hypothetical protein